MRNRTNSSADPGSWLAALARRLRDWLNHYLGEEASLAAEGGRAVSDREGENDPAQSSPQGSMDPLEHWLDLVRKAAPELLIPAEEGGTPRVYAGEVQDTQNPEEIMGPEDLAALEASSPTSSLPCDPEQEKDQAKGQTKGQTKGKTSPPVDKAKHVTTKAVQPAQMITTEPADRKTNAVLSRSDERHGHASPSSQVDVATNEVARLQQPSLKPMVDGKGASRQMDLVTREISPPEELSTQASASMRPDVARDARSTSPAAPSHLHNRPPARAAMEHGEAPVANSADFTTLPSAVRTSNRAPNLVHGPRKETVERQQNIDLDSASALSSQVVNSQPSSQKQPPWLSLQVKPSVRQPEFNQTGTWPALPTSEQHGIDLLSPAQQRPDNPKSTGDRRPLFTRSANESTVPVSNLKAESNADWWPKLPEVPSPEDVDDVKLFRDLEHVQALDLEQGGL